MIEAHGLVKRYGSTMAVNDLSFSIRPGMVTGFLGPNGAGKTTTMRMILGLDAPAQGSVTVGGRSYRDLPAPMREVGALLDAKALHGGRRACDHLLCLARSNGIPRSRVDEVLRIVGLENVARRRAKSFSLGMGQRLGIASALLGRPCPHAALGDPGVARAVAGAGLYLTALAVLSVAAGALLRRPAAAIAAMMAVLLVLPGIAQALPDSWRHPVTEFWPTQAGSQVTNVYHSAHTLQPWPGFGVMCLFVAIVYAIAWTLLDRRDA
jgi:ABC-type transport system involved in cytochrome c biogenesis ATPase subunit